MIGEDFELSDALEALKDQFKLIQFRTEQQLNIDSVNRVYQILDLDENYAKGYSKNAKRLIKKSNANYTCKIVDCRTELIDLIKEHVAHKIKEFTPKNIQRLHQLMNHAVANQKGETIGVYDNDVLVAAGFFFKDKSTITYLKGASTDSAKKNGAMYGLLDFAFQTYHNHYQTFDFGGSNVENVATFYKKLGGRDKTYYEYQINNLPLWFKGLKKLKNNG